jgi:DNA-3-methyladenine glycosylase II
MSRAESWRGTRIYSIGHSTRAFHELVRLLRAFDVSVLADIRTIPRSRRNPAFNGDTLPAALRPWHLRYVHLPSLGGLRRARRDSVNTGWRNASFRGFADHMGTKDFERGLEALRALTRHGRVALMCAEILPWRCHRALVADALTVRGANVEHIINSIRPTPHTLTSFARVKDSCVTYPEEDAAGEQLSTRGPFHLEATVRVLQRQPANRVEVWDRGRYRRVLTSMDGLVLVEVENRGTIDAPDVRLFVPWGDPPVAARSGLAQTVRKVLGLDVRPEPLQRRIEAEPALRSAALALRGMRPPRFAEWFEAFANVIPFQQVSLDAGLAVVGRVVERFSQHIEHDGRRYHAFPTAPAIAGARLDALRRCGLSARKAESLRHIARAIESGELTEEKISGMNTSDALRALTELPGIGPWSAGLVLLRGLGRMDVFPPGDVGAARRLHALMGLRPGTSFSRAVDRFGDHRGYLYFCGLGGSLLARGLIHAAPLKPTRPTRTAGECASLPSSSPVQHCSRAGGRADPIVQSR